MILAANQPYYLPYIGYWQLIRTADIFLIGDDYQYKTRSWISRNRILLQGKPAWFGIEIGKASSSRLCTELHMAPVNWKKKQDILYNAYHKAPYYREGIRLMEEIRDCDKTILSEFLLHSIRTVCRYLQISTPIARTSDLEGNRAYRREERIYDMCHRLGADTYINPIGGMEIYDFAGFREQGIALKFLRADEIVYKQFDDQFVPNLSILDLVMFNSREEVITMLDRYKLITGPQAFDKTEKGQI